MELAFEWRVNPCRFEEDGATLLANWIPVLRKHVEKMLDEMDRQKTGISLALSNHTGQWAADALRKCGLHVVRSFSKNNGYLTELAGLHVAVYVPHEIKFLNSLKKSDLKIVVEEERKVLVRHLIGAGLRRTEGPTGVSASILELK